MEIRLLIIDFFLFNGYIGWIEDDQFWLKLLRSEAAVVEDGSIDLDDVQAVVLVIVLGKQRGVHVDINTDMQ